MTQAHILIIDDRPDTLQSLSSELQNQGWHVSVATQGKQGFHRAQALEPDLILLDVGMPDMDGFAIARLLMESSRTQDIPIIFLTGSDAGEQRLEGLELGAVDYVSKPFLPAEVVARIRIHLQRVQPAPEEPPDGPMPLLSDGQVTLRAAMRWINANLADLPSLTVIAQQVGTHDKKLSAIFRKHLGMTVFAWVREERLRVAGEWLADSHMSVQDIALQVGFHSAANFATAFRKRMGVTPSEYRASLPQSGDRGVDAT